MESTIFYTAETNDQSVLYVKGETVADMKPGASQKRQPVLGNNSEIDMQIVCPAASPKYENGSDKSCKDREGTATLSSAFDGVDQTKMTTCDDKENDTPQLPPAKRRIINSRHLVPLPLALMQKVKSEPGRELVKQGDTKTDDFRQSRPSNFGSNRSLSRSSVSGMPMSRTRSAHYRIFPPCSKSGFFH